MQRDENLRTIVRNRQEVLREESWIDNLYYDRYEDIFLKNRIFKQNLRFFSIGLAAPKAHFWKK